MVARERPRQRNLKFTVVFGVAQTSLTDGGTLVFCIQQNIRIALPALAVGKHTSTNLEARCRKVCGLFSCWNDAGILEQARHRLHSSRGGLENRTVSSIDGGNSGGRKSVDDCCAQLS
jgi:hypothetical protein